MPTSAGCIADLAVLHRSLAANGSTTLARGRLKTLRRAVDVFGFHLASIDLRQNSDVHERAVGELLEIACPGTGYAGAQRGSARGAAAGGARDVEARSPRRSCPTPPRRPRSLRSSAPRPRRIGNTASPRCPTTSSPRPTAPPTSSRSPFCSRKRAAAAARGHARPQHRAAVRDDRGSAQLRPRDGPAARLCRSTRACSKAAADGRR